jgi:hypothetical protein
MKINTPILFTTIGLMCFGLLPKAQAVSPPPDGGYPGLNTAEGTNALKNLTTGAANTAVGWFSLFSNAEGSFNTGVGVGTLVLNTADSNTAVGAAALLLNTTGTENTAVGTAALETNETAEQNTATGAFALFSHMTGNGNTANGANALFSDVSGQLNTATGAGALFNVNNGFNGSFNTADGAGALFSNTGADNTGVGATALGNNTTGHDNTAVGISALPNNDTGSNNIALGAFAGQAVTTASQTISIGVQGSNTDNSCFIGQIFNASSPGGSAVFIDANDRLGTVTSSRRFKEDIQSMGTASEALLGLKPVTFRYKKEIDPAGTPQLGLVAEDVERVNPDLVVRDKDGKPYSVRYDQVNAMLLNEFLKEHRKVQELEAIVAQQQKGMEAVLARLNEYDSKIQKVSMQVELSRSATRLAGDNQ